MENFYSMLITLGLSIIFVLIYAIHRLFFNVSYFGFSEVVYGYKDKITIKAVLLRLFIPFIYACITYYFTNSMILTLSGVFWGSILIIIPPFLNPECSDGRFYNLRNLLYFVYIVFLILNCCVAQFALNIFNSLQKYIIGYFNQFQTSQQLFNHLVDILIFPIIITILLGFLKFMFNLMNKEIQVNYANFQDDENEEI